MTYAEKLLDPRWQKKRLSVLKRDKFSCTLCSDETETLHVHHLSYKRGKDPWQYQLQNFKTLCKTCHSVVEFLKEDEFGYPKSIIKMGWRQGFLLLTIDANNTMRFICHENNDTQELFSFNCELLRSWINFAFMHCDRNILSKNKNEEN